MDFWIRDPLPTIAHQMIEGGYIPYGPEHGGRMIMDDFGNLQQALPKDHYFDLPFIYELWVWGFEADHHQLH